MGPWRQLSYMEQPATTVFFTNAFFAIVLYIYSSAHFSETSFTDLEFRRLKDTRRAQFRVRKPARLPSALAARRARLIESSAQDRIASQLTRILDVSRLSIRPTCTYSSCPIEIASSSYIIFHLSLPMEESNYP